MSPARKPEDSLRHVVTPVSVRAIRRDELLFYPLTTDETAKRVRAALDEDGACNDIPTLATRRSDRRTHATLVTRQPGARGGARRGGEALNFMQRLSGIATLTRGYVDAIAGTKAKIRDTRKTTPGWRRLEKYAVRAGGGTNHRMDLATCVLIKDNHLAAVDGDIALAVQRARELAPAGTKVEVECDRREQVERALAAGADIIMLDNMTLPDMRECVELVKGRAIVEASGGVTRERVRAIADTGVDWISVGALTHSAPAMDLALDFDP